MDLIDTPIDGSLLRGHLDLESTARGLLPHRLPAAARRRIPDARLTSAEAQPSGVRLSFRTAATVIELETLPTKRAYAGLPPLPDGVYDLVVDGGLVARTTVPGGNVETVVDMVTQEAEFTEGPTGIARFADLPAGEKDVEIWLPHNEITELIALRADAPVAPLPRRERVWLHHGSSISHGSGATHPTGTWPAIAAASGGVDLINLGFGGSALLDSFVARTIRDTPADLISLKIGINLTNMDVMRLRAFVPAVHGFLDTVRDGHPTTPLLLVSPILCPIQEDTPGPVMPVPSAAGLRFEATGDPAEVPAGRLTLSVIRDALERIAADRAGEDANLHLLDGRALYGVDDNARLPLPDELHPDAATHALIGARFGELAFGAGGPFTS
ncbi:GDSL-type esterase/lipase family protein [Tsukamurella pseudospumae]|uniref:Lipase n=1 Tax=Tsukamurella pseudospumae TaxID=239498 RepID=A0A138ANV7_9ACTN|nr:SGNH/GDSL hydrolase family protein [Tsukamurella pseudospumae]KXP12136.1 lipase [Tsukamurella pseudospumae]